MTEASYWESVYTTLGYNATHQQFEINSTELPKHIIYSEADDLEVTIISEVLNKDIWGQMKAPLSASFLCKFSYESRGKAWCLVQCDGVHF
jgi:hypothetical protein